VFKVEIITVGKPKTAWIKQGIEHYRKLASRYADVSFTTVREGDSAQLSEERVREIEGERIITRLKSCPVYVLDKDGRSIDSPALAAAFADCARASPRVQFVIGGPFGLSPQVTGAGRTVLSLSRMTFPHELTLLLLLEQVYRALSINAGSKYHK
jgi:23S rRNA (pseudouridine1915-N3)-methyltransferase